MTITRLKSLFLFIFIFGVYSCTDPYESQEVTLENSRHVVKPEDIPHVTSKLFDRLGLSNGSERLSIATETGNSEFNIDWTKILESIDQSGNSTYTFFLTSNNNEARVFYNLVMRLDSENNAYKPFIVRYEMTEEFFGQYQSTLSFDGYDGEMRIIPVKGSGGSTENQANLDNNIRSITPDGECPEENVGINDGTSSGGSGGLGSTGGGGSVTLVTVTRCDYYLVKNFYDTYVNGQYSSSNYYYTWEEDCYEYSYYSHTEVANTDNCELGDGEIPIIEPYTHYKIRQLVECDSTALLNQISGAPSNDYQSWSGLAKHKASSDVQNRLNSIGGFDLSLANARGPVANMDDFSVNIENLPPGMSAMDLFQEFRKNINSFVDQNISTFVPYSSDDVNTWLSNNPLGSMFSIQFYDPIFGVNIDDGSVITSEYSGGTWIFSTAWTPKDGQHPVSGNREFGFSTNSDGSFTFFTRGVDRITTQFNATAQYFTNSVFGGADKLWSSFQTKLANYVNQNGGQASIVPPIKHRVDWDLVKSYLFAELEVPECNN